MCTLPAMIVREYAVPGLLHQSECLAEGVACLARTSNINIMRSVWLFVYSEVIGGTMRFGSTAEVLANRVLKY